MVQKPNSLWKRCLAWEQGRRLRPRFRRLSLAISFLLIAAMLATEIVAGVTMTAGLVLLNCALAWMVSELTDAVARRFQLRADGAR